jgi:hypothetical protein
MTFGHAGLRSEPRFLFGAEPRTQLFYMGLCPRTPAQGTFLKKVPYMSQNMSQNMSQRENTKK